MWLTRKLAALASFDRKPKKQEPEKEPVKEPPAPAAPKPAAEPVEDLAKQPREKVVSSDRESKPATNDTNEPKPAATAAIVRNKESKPAIATVANKESKPKPPKESKSTKESKPAKESKSKEKKESKKKSKDKKEKPPKESKKESKKKSKKDAKSIDGEKEPKPKESKSKTVLTQLRKIKSNKSSSSDAKSTKSTTRSIRTLGSFRGSLRSKASIKSNATAKTTTSTAASTTTIDPITKPLPPIIPQQPTQKVCDKTIVIVISGTLNIGKSTLIRLGLQNLTADQNNATQWQCHRTMFTLDDIKYPMDVIEIDDTMINTNQDPPEFPEDLGNVHGGLICYDTTNRDSMDCLPDLLNAYVSRNIPSYLIGLKADLSSLRQVDPELGRKLGNLFGVELFEVDAFSEDGTKRMKDIYAMLVKQCIKDHGDEFQSYHHAATPAQASDNESTITMRERRISGEATSLKSRKSTDGLSEHSANDEPVRRSSFSSDASFSSDYRFPSLSSKKAAVAAASDAESKPLTGFVYAPTTTTTATITATATSTTTATTTTTTATTTTTTATTTKQTNDDVIERKSSLHNTPYAKKGLASRRGSKDSCESMGTGLTTDDLIDKLLADDPPRSDEHIATIFITFFRRFMKPGDLARALIDRFDSDGLLEPPPTRLQERIQAIFLIWLTSYWNDFHSRRTRKTIINFLERISKEQVLRPISDSLTPLANRMPPDDDPDAHWGMADDDNEDFDDQDDAASDSSDDDVFEECEGTTMDEMEEAPAPAPAKNKKDSGYSSESFVNFFTSNDDKPQDSKSISEGCYSAPETPVVADPPPIKRTASVSSFSLFGRPRKSSITSSLGFLFSFAPMTAAKPAEEEPKPAKEEPEEPKEEVKQIKKEEPKKEEPKKDEPKKDEPKKEEPKKKEPKKEEPKKPEPESKKEEKTTTPPTPPSKTKPKQSTMSTSSSAAEIASRRTSVDARSTTTTDRPTNSGTSNRTEFAGGLINIDSHCGMSTSPSWTSFGANTISSSAASFISVFGGYREKPEKDQLNYNYKVIMEIPDQAVADQLTWIESELFGKIKAREFVRNIWSARPSSVSSEDQLKCHSAVVASIAHFNFISAWVATVIVTQPKLNKRAALLEKFMSIAVELRNHNNYNSLMAVLAGLNSASVLRMKQTREAISDKKIYKQFQSLERLMSSDRSFSSYRLALKASEAPGIPYLGIHNQDLVSLAEGNKDFRPDGTIHWEKFRLMGECIVAMMKFQCPAYDIDPDGKILHFIADTEILSEDEQYKRSNLVEPRLKSSSTNRLRDLWLRV